MTKKVLLFACAILTLAPAATASADISWDGMDRLCNGRDIATGARVASGAAADQFILCQTILRTAVQTHDLLRDLWHVPPAIRVPDGISTRTATLMFAAWLQVRTRRYADDGTGSAGFIALMFLTETWPAL